MAVRSIFVVSLNDSQLLFHKSFPTVECRWARKHGQLYRKLPQRLNLMQPLLSELGLLDTLIFKGTRDSCTKMLQAPLFWIPYEENSHYFWPAVVVECKCLLFCAVPCIDQTNAVNMQSTINCPNLTICFELLSKLLPTASCSPSKISGHLGKIIDQWIPFGRPKCAQGLELLSKPNSAQKGIWLWPKSQIDVKIKEEIRAIINREGTRAELYGSLVFNLELNVDLNETEFHLQFTKLNEQPKLIIHSCLNATYENNAVCLHVKELQEKNIVLCHYSLPLKDPPVTAVFKTRSNALLCSMFVQLHVNSTLRNELTRLEITLPMPSKIRITKIVTNPSQNPGTIRIDKDGALLVWTLSSLIATAKLREDTFLNIDIEINEIASLEDVQALVMFSATDWTYSGVTLTFPQQIPYKLLISQEIRSSTFKVWNHGAMQVL